MATPWRRLALKSVLGLRGLVELGPSTTRAIVANSLRTGLEDHRDRRQEGRPALPRAPGRLQSAEPLAAGARCRFEEADLELTFLAEDLVRVHWGPGLPPLPWALNGPLAGPGRVEPSVTLTTGPDGACLVSSRALEIEVGPTGELRYHIGGRLVRHELAPLRRGSTRTSRFRLRAGERVCGLGEQAGPVDLRGRVHRLFNRDPGGSYGPGQDPLYCAIPVLVGLHPEGDVLTFYENSFEALVRLGDRAELTFAGGLARHYVATGPLPRILERYAALTGLAPLPPRWALGYHQCRWGYRSAEDVREVARGFARERLPMSALHLDIDYMDGYRAFTVDRERFSDLPGLSAELFSGGTRLVTIVDPAVKEDPGFELFEEGRRHGHFLCRPGTEEPYVGAVWPGRAVFPDFTDPATRDWWAGQYRTLLDQGVAGFWHDMNEPTSISLFGDRTLPGSVPHAAEGRGGDHRECHNVYGLLMDRVGWEAQAELRPDRRPFVLSRSGWAGLARWAWNWTGDIESSWEGLAQQIPTAIGLGLSGVPYTGSDIGGFSGSPDPELYLRWLELAVLMPFCRTHSVTGAPPREPWRFPEPHRGAIGRLIRLRYRLLPYLYALAEEAARTGWPLVRPLAWTETGSSGDRRLWWCEDSYLLGDRLLVAPVTRPGAAGREVVLPEGPWYHWSDPAGPGTGWRRLAGGRSVSLTAPPGQPVVLARGGTIVPLDDGWTRPGRTLEPSHAPLGLAFHCFPDDRGHARGDAYDDAGDGSGPGRRDQLDLAAAEDAGALLTWRTEGAWPRPGEVTVVVHGRDPGRAIADGQEVAVERAGGASTVRTPGFERLTLEW